MSQFGIIFPLGYEDDIELEEYVFDTSFVVQVIPKVGPMGSDNFYTREEKIKLLEECRLMSTENFVSEPAPSANYGSVSRVDGCQVLKKNAIITRVDDNYHIEKFKRVEIVPVRIVNTYFATGMHCGYEQMALYHAYIAARVCPEIPLPIFQKSDGQLKICTDFVVGIDHHLARNGSNFSSDNPFKILVIGSSGESGISGISYQILQYMDIYAEIDLYDPYETNKDVTIGKVKYKHHRALWDYSIKPIHHIVFDDTYVVGVYNVSHRELLDPYQVILTANDYSIKCLTYDHDYFKGCIRYDQAFKTTTSEIRVVKYPRLFGKYRNLFGGNCHACVHLKYMLKRDYSNKFYDYYLRMHKSSCVAGMAVFSREVRFSFQCCINSKSESSTRLELCKTHKTSVSLYCVDRLDSRRVLVHYTSKLLYDVLAVSDVQFKVTSNMVLPVACKVFMICESIVIEFFGSYYVSEVRSNETVKEKPVVFQLKFDN